MLLYRSKRRVVLAGPEVDDKSFGSSSSVGAWARETGRCSLQTARSGACVAIFGREKSQNAWIFVMQLLEWKV